MLTNRHKNNSKKIRLVGWILMILYLFLLIYFLFFAEWYGRGPKVNTEPRYNLIPFLEIRRFLDNWELLGVKAVILNLIGNVVGFVPFGFLLPVIFHQMKQTGIVLYWGMIFSVFIECMQLLLRVGSCDIDDVILNTMGTAIGYVCYLIGFRRRTKTDRSKKYDKKAKI